MTKSGPQSGPKSSYQVIARKWRPQSFGDLVGQEHISTTLLNALRHNRLPQALLFTGVRGTGKTSSARILAKSLRCPNAKDFVPCGVCPECEDIANSRSLAVIEIDGASNNGVDAIRELRETVGYMPPSGKYKVYIIDEVHMLSTSAFNALLKTLEEPPAHVVFIMATTEVQKIPSTILSRCQRFDFRRIPSRQIAAQLTKICDAEGVKTEPEAIWLLARHGDGSLRDSQSLLDQVITFCDGTVTLEKVTDVLGLTDRSLLLDTVAALVGRDTQSVVDVIEKVFKAGYDPKVFAQDLLEEIRNALLVRLCTDDPTRVVDLPDTEIDGLRKLTEPLSEEDLHFLFDMTLKGVNDLLRSQDARIVLEMLLLRMAAAPRIASLAALANGTALPAAPARATAQTQAHSSVHAASAPASEKVSIPLMTAEAVVANHQPQARPQYTAASFSRPANTPPGTPMPPASAAPASAAPAPAAPLPAQQAGPRTSAQLEAAEPPPVDEAKSNDPWYKFVIRVKSANGLLGAMLENTHMIAHEAGKLVIGVPRKMNFLIDKIKEEENVKRIESFVETFWNKKVSVEVKLADEQANQAQPATPKSVADDHVKAQTKSVEQAVEQNALVQTAQNVFKTQIKSIKNKRETT